MKKYLSLLLALVMSMSLVACSSNTESAESTDTTETTTTEVGTAAETTESEDPTFVTVMVDDAEGNKIPVEFPTDVDSVVVLNYQTLDFMDALGLGHLVTGMVGDTSNLAEHLHKYVDSTTSVGTGLKDIDVEALALLQPDIIFSSDRTKANYDLYSEIAPTYCAYVDYTMDTFMDGFEKLANDHAAIFGVEDEVGALLDGYYARIDAIKAVAEGQTALVGLFTGEQVNTLGDNSRCSILTRDMGFTNLASELDVNHGAESSYETYLAVNPDWMFILDKDAATNAPATLAEDLMDNEIIYQTSAYKNDQIVYLQPGNVWYINDGGIQSLDMMITCVEEALGLA